mgnify:CR=1 FL=1
MRMSNGPSFITTLITFVGLDVKMRLLSPVAVELLMVIVLIARIVKPAGSVMTAVSADTL